MRIVVVAALLLLSSPLGAQTLGPDAPPAADLRYQRGIELFQQGRFALAAQEFRVALELVPGSARLAYNLARSLESAGQLDRAIEAYRQYLVLSPQADDRPAVDGFIRALSKELERQRGAVLVTTTPEGAQIFVDQEASAGRAPLTLRLAPGHHVLRLEADGYRQAVREVEVAEGGSGAVDVTLEVLRTEVVEPAVGAAAEPGVSGRGLLGWSLVGAGVASVAAGVVFYAKASDAADQASEGGISRNRHAALEDDFGTQNALAWTGLGLGAALTAAGVTLLVLPEDEAVSLGPTLGGAWVRVRW